MEFPIERALSQHDAGAFHCLGECGMKWISVRMAQGYLEKLDVSFHLDRIENLVEQHQAMNGLSNRRALWGIHNATMRMPSRMETEEIAVLCKDDALFSMGSLHMYGIGCAEETSLTYCLDINASFAQALYNGSGNVFVEIEPNFPRHSACA
jgi:hypothetical protein